MGPPALGWFDMTAMVIAMSMAWSPVSNVYAASSDEPVADHKRRRAFLRRTVERAFAPQVRAADGSVQTSTRTS